MTDPDVILRQESYDHGQLAEVLLERHFAALHYLAYSLLGDAEGADDAVQETIIKALGIIDHYQPGSSMKAWLNSILVNKCRDKIRRRQSRRRLVDGLQLIFRSRRSPLSPEQKRVGREARSALWHAVDQIGEKHRVAIVLRYVHDYSARDIAQILNIREGTVHSRLHHACRALRRQLAFDDRQDLVEELLDE